MSCGAVVLLPLLLPPPPPLLLLLLKQPGIGSCSELHVCECWLNIPWLSAVTICFEPARTNASPIFNFTLRAPFSALGCICRLAPLPQKQHPQLHVLLDPPRPFLSSSLAHASSVPSCPPFSARFWRSVTQCSGRLAVCVAGVALVGAHRQVSDFLKGELCRLHHLLASEASAATAAATVPQ